LFELIEGKKGGGIEFDWWIVPAIPELEGVAQGENQGHFRQLCV